MANGRVVTGFSKPYVAQYVANAGTVSHTGGMPMARGVSVDLDVETGEDNNFYADNVTAETAPGIFTGGKVNVTVDGLKTVARKFMFGLPKTRTITVNGEEVEVTDYGDDMKIPYLGFGFLVRYQEDGVVTYEPTVLPKVRFATEGLSAKTQEEEIDWQTRELSAEIMRDDSQKHNWKWIAAAQTTEEAAEKVLQVMLGITEEPAPEDPPEETAGGEAA